MPGGASGAAVVIAVAVAVEAVAAATASQRTIGDRTAVFGPDGRGQR